VLKQLYGGFLWIIIEKLMLKIIIAVIDQENAKNKSKNRLKKIQK
jgi:hypothetical protein